ncbi:unnamed protein product [Cyclocybe aegerita]|uniref:Uncharacterized protein n=1 Tax=Cyclocybe aegerita TaxID=1973307 RepID=A0A8S0VZ31_CYCAE|nr:unnamed protein product [Cyclocybe aegerita]
MKELLEVDVCKRDKVYESATSGTDTGLLTQREITSHVRPLLTERLLLVSSPSALLPLPPILCPPARVIMSAVDGTFMSITAALALGPESKSFEEVRIEDYIKAYQTTSRPPQPVPQQPTDEIARKALNLPPLFKPTTMSMGGGGAPASTSAPIVFQIPVKIVNPAELPQGQEFRVTQFAGEKHHNIVSMPQYDGFSPEELRFYAYSRGNITSPVTILMDPFVLPAKETPKAPVVATTTVDDEQLQHICANTAHMRHSPEELRVAYFIHGREMTSAELMPGATVPSAQPPAPIIPAAPLAALPQPIYASSTPKFTFGLR